MPLKKCACLTLALILLIFSLTGCTEAPSSEIKNNDKTSQNNQPQDGPSNQPAGPVADELDIQAVSALPDAVLSDLYHWSGGSVKYQDEPSVSGDTHYIYYTAQMDTVKAYVEMLKSSGFTLVGEYEGYNQSMYYWSLTCDAASNLPMIHDIITETNCHVSIGWSNRSSSKFMFSISKNLPVLDTGTRMNGTTVDISLKGPSIGSGLIRNEDGSYSTTDGRLTTNASSATIVRDDQQFTAAVTYDEQYERQHVYTEDYYRNESIYLQFPLNSILQNDCFSHTDMRSWNLTEHTDGEEAHYNYDAPFTVFLFHDGYMRQSAYNESYFEAASVRVMYYEKGVEAVFYVYGKFMGLGSPKEIEALIAVDMSKLLSANDSNNGSGGGDSTIIGGDGVYVPDHSKLDCLTCRGSGDCTSCNGYGNNNIGGFNGSCLTCMGSGKCQACNGTGTR